MKFRFAVWLMSVVVMAPPVALAADPWRTTLDDGSVVHVDPSTNRATVTSPEGVTTQIWDGVHKLQDGSTITTNNGIVVPTQQIWQSRQPMTPLKVEVSTDTSPECKMLQEAVCGSDNACADSEPCKFARQLVQFDKEEAIDINAGKSMSERMMPSQCREAFRDRVKFPPCKR